MTILLVDDDLTDARLVREILTRQDSDLTVIDAETCEDALRVADTAQIDCIVMDEKLVRTRGSECVEHLRQQGYIGAFILLTGFPDSKIAVDAMMNGADNYLSKDDVRAGLLAAIRKAVEKRHAATAMQHAAEEKEKRYLDQVQELDALRRGSPVIAPALSEAVQDIQNIKETIAGLGQQVVNIESNTAKQFELFLKLQSGWQEMLGNMQEGLLKLQEGEQSLRRYASNARKDWWVRFFTWLALVVNAIVLLYKAYKGT